MKFYENNKKFSKREENIVGKGEIAHYEQFLFFPQCFQMTCTALHGKAKIRVVDELLVMMHVQPVSLSPARWHCKHTYLFSQGMLGTTQFYLQII